MRSGALKADKHPGVLAMVHLSNPRVLCMVLTIDCYRRPPKSIPKRIPAYINAHINHIKAYNCWPSTVFRAVNTPARIWAIKASSIYKSTAYGIDNHLLPKVIQVYIHKNTFTRPWPIRVVKWVCYLASFCIRSWQYTCSIYRAQRGTDKHLGVWLWYT